MKESKLANIRFKNAGKVYCFSTDLELIKDDYVIVDTVRGSELGVVCNELKKISEFNLKTELKKITRKATKEDIDRYEKNQKDAVMALEKCKKIITKYNVVMQLTDCEYTLDRSKIIFMYTSDERVDFRILLKELATTFKCRIELRQIGARDKAKLVGGLGVCGLQLCCSSFLGDFNGVSINMAKNQLLAINIDKLSGMCGRLMCCLKYEDELYTKAKKKFPKNGSMVEHNADKCKVIGLNIISNIVKVDKKGTIEFVPLDEIKQRSDKNGSN